MNKDELISIFENILKEYSPNTEPLSLEGEYEIEYIQVESLMTYINNLKKENQQLKENNQAMQEEMTRTWKKLDVLKELKRWLKEQVESPKDFWSVMRINDILSKINELEKNRYEI